MKERLFMHKCLELAQKAKGYTAPNPMVGALLVHNERIIGQGWHHFYGADHAEVNCLDTVINADRKLIPESTMYVNLEPCAHYGITPPCAARLVQEQVRRVVIANADPFEKVSGKGIDMLKEAGVQVECGLLEKEGMWVNRRFFCYQQQKRPYIILKWAQTRGGFIAPPDKSRLQITGKESQKLLHQWRTEEGAIMVGTTTALKDNPHLTARLYNGKQPLRIIIDRKLQLPDTHHVFDADAATWIINEQHESLDGNVHLVKLNFDDTLLQQVLERLYQVKILSLIVEGGAALLNSFLAAGLWDEARIFTGNVFLQSGIPAPKIEDVNSAFNAHIGDDSLQVIVNKNSAYQYISGMDL